MHKILFKIPLPDFIASTLHVNHIIVYSYAFCVVFGALIACWLIKKYSFNTLNFKLSNNFFYCAFIFGFVGGKLFYYLEKPILYLSHPCLMLNNFSGGFVCYGSILGVTLYAWLFARAYKINVLGMLDLLSIYTILPIAFGRIGCFLNGCCFGKPTDSFIGIIFPTTAPIEVHPTQLYEVVLMLFIMIALLYANKTKTWEGQVFILNLSLYAVGRALIELLRGDDRGIKYFSTLSQAQFIACIMVIISGLILNQQKKINKSNIQK